MRFLGFGKKNRVLDLSEKYKKQQERMAQKKEDINPSGDLHEENSQSPSQGAFSFLGNLASSNSEQHDDLNTAGEEKKKRLAKRLIDMTNKIEDLSNQIYHLQQRIEVLEKKSGVGNY